MTLRTKSPFSFARNGPCGRVSLAEFVTRPQAELQIGATVGVCPQLFEVSIAALIIAGSHGRRISLDCRPLPMPGALGGLRSRRHHLLPELFPLDRRRELGAVRSGRLW